MMMMMKMNKDVQKSIVIVFFLGMLVAIFAPIILEENPINNGGDVAIPATETIVISPRSNLSEETCAPVAN